jgi:hypothetical protein
MRKKRPLRCGLSLSFLPVFFGLAGCTTVTIQGATSVTSSHFGVLRIATDQSAPLTSVHIRGFGLVPSYSGVTVGKSDEIVVAVTDDKSCHAVFIVDSDAQVKSIVATFQSANMNTSSLCEVRGEKQ